jgi:hypothetical protein
MVVVRATAAETGQVQRCAEAGFFGDDTAYHHEDGANDKAHHNREPNLTGGTMNP